MTAEAAITRYCAVLSDLTPDRLSELARLCAQDFRFKDPFNDTVGRDAYLAVLAKMFEDVESHSFRVLGRADGGEACYLRWSFQARLRKSGIRLDIEGMSEITVDDHGLIASHVDFWDAGRGVYERLPLLRGLISWIRRRAAA